MRRFAGLALGCALLVGCTHDFGAFDPAGGPASDSTPGADGGAETSVPPRDGAAVDTASGSDTSSGADTTPAVDSGATADTEPVDTGSVVDTAAPCTDPGARPFDGHCYFPLGSDTWDGAKTKCASSGAHLVTIETAAEQAFVEGIKNGKRWIGLQRPAGAPAAPASYAWITGESTAYQNWASGEPAGSGDCGNLTRTGAWGDEDCTVSQVAICERD